MKNSDLQLKIDQSVGTPLLVADFNVLLWKIIAFVEESSMVYKKNRTNIIKLATAYIFNRGPAGLPIQDYRITVIADGPSDKYGNGYWRHYEMGKDPRIQEAWDNYKPKKKDRSYKGGRGAKPDIFYECYDIAKEYCLNYLNFYKFEGFEADCLAGALYRSELKRQKNRVKIWYTVDRDWQQLINDDLGYYWYTMRVPRANEMFQEQGANNIDVLLYAEKKLGMSISNPQELILAKVEFGDAGDNCPPLTPAEYMDLVSPHPKYAIEKLYPELYSKMVNDSLILEPNNRLDHLEETEKMFKKLNLEFMYRG